MEQLKEITGSHIACDLNINIYDNLVIFIILPQLKCILRNGIIIPNNKSSRLYEGTGQFTL